MGLSAQTVLLAGASGLVGNRVLRRLLADPRFSGRIIAPVRKALTASDPRLFAPVLDFSLGDEDFAQALDAAAPGPIDAYVCCLGSTIKAAGSRQGFIAVDRELVLRLSRTARARGARQAILVSSVGASRQSANFYLRVKGEVEDALEQAGYERLDLMRPGLLLGPRAERRPLESLLQRLAPISNLAMHGRLKPYRSVPADTLARAMLSLIGRPEPGVHAHGYGEIVQAAG